MTSHIRNIIDLQTIGVSQPGNRLFYIDCIEVLRECVSYTTQRLYLAVQLLQQPHPSLFLEIALESNQLRTSFGGLVQCVR